MWRYLSAEAREHHASVTVAAKTVRQRVEALEKATAAKIAKGDGKGGGKQGISKGASKGDPKGGKGGPNAPKGGKTDGGKTSSPVAQAGEDCKFFLSKEGCKRGGLCHYNHPRLSAKDGRCFNCGSTEHSMEACERPKKPPKAKKVEAPSTEQPVGVIKVTTPTSAGTTMSVSSGSSTSDIVKEAVAATIMALADPGAKAVKFGNHVASSRGEPWWTKSAPSAMMMTVSDNKAGHGGLSEDRTTLTDTAASSGGEPTVKEEEENRGGSPSAKEPKNLEKDVVLEWRTVNLIKRHGEELLQPEKEETRGESPSAGRKENRGESPSEEKEENRGGSPVTRVLTVDERKRTEAVIRLDNSKLCAAVERARRIVGTGESSGSREPDRELQGSTCEDKTKTERERRKPSSDDEKEHPVKQAAQSPVVEPGALSARTRAEELLLADTGATHELDSVKPGIIPETNARRVKLHVATGKEDAWITEEEVVYVESEDRLQRLFPIGVYVTECDLQWVWQGPQCKLVLPGGAEIGLIVKGRCIYIRESDAATLRKLRKELRERNMAISMKWAHVYTVTVQQLRQHQLLGHPSFLKECRDCRLAAGRMRVHRRMDPSLRPGGELSLDVSGPHSPAIWPSAFPEDTTKRARYFLLAAYQVFTAAELEERVRLHEEARKAAGLDASVAVDVSHLATSATLRLDYVANEAGEVDETKVLYFTEPLQTKAVKETLPAIQRIVAAVELEFKSPVVHRIHGDKASELTGQAVRDHFAGHGGCGIVVTSTPGGEPNNNGRAEKGIGCVKSTARAMLMRMSGADRSVLWATAVQHSSWCQRNRVLKRPTPQAAYGDPVTARLKDVPNDSFAARAVERTFVGVCDGVSHGFLLGKKVEGVWSLEVSSSFVLDGTPIQVKEKEKWELVGEDKDESLKEEEFPDDLAAPVDEPPQPDVVLLQDGEVDPFGETDGTEVYSCPACNGKKRAHRRDHTCRLGPAVAAAVANSEFEEEDAPPEFREIVKESGMQLVSIRDIKSSIGVEKEEWYYSAQEELDSQRSKGTHDVLTPEERARVNPKSIMPMKTVHGVKGAEENGRRRKKVRAVVCGNYQSKQPGEDVYTENVDVSTVRLAIAVAARRKWSLGALDIKTAFLNADVPPSEEDVIMKPPPLFVWMGLCAPDELWRAKKAIYGLRASPKAWADKRDKIMSEKEFVVKGKNYKLKRSHVDTSLWCIVDKEEPQQESRRKVYGYILTYVDDYLYTAEDAFMPQIEAFVKELWTVSLQPVLHYGTTGVLTYLAFTIEGRCDGYCVHQQAYIHDLIEKWGMKDATAVGTIDIEAYNDDEELEEPPLADVRLAQKMSGGLIWLSGRSRPDISYSVSRISSQCTIRPLWSLRLGKRVLRYLIGTTAFVLMYLSGDGRGPEFVDVFADASFEPTRAQSGIVVYFCLMLVDWRSSKQAQTARSTGEAELTSLATANLVLEGTEAVVNSMFIDVKTTLHGDNQASIAMAHGHNSWRTRALCNRSFALKARVADGSLHLVFVGTKDQKGDGLTKFLSVPGMSRSRHALCLVRI